MDPPTGALHVSDPRPSPPHLRTASRAQAEDLGRGWGGLLEACCHLTSGAPCHSSSELRNSGFESASSGCRGPQGSRVQRCPVPTVSPGSSSEGKCLPREKWLSFHCSLGWGAGAGPAHGRSPAALDEWVTPQQLIRKRVLSGGRGRFGDHLLCVRRCVRHSG